LEGLREHIQKVLGELSTLNYKPDISIAIAGTPTTLACMDLNLGKYDDKLIEGHKLSYYKIDEIVNIIQNLTFTEIKNTYKCIVKGREDLILAGSIILLKIMELTKVDYIIVSTKGIRYGAIIKEVI
jgi:exopolyphosphatase/guanosine-5'-triphosphate,3'-diphosphate pyrophosphatase